MLFFNEDFWIGISFGIFVYLVYKPLKNIILKTLDAKILAIQQQVVESQKLNDDMESRVKGTLSQIQTIETLREEMLTKGRKITNILVEEQSEEIKRLLENKKLSVINSINNTNSKALHQLQIEFGNKIVALTSLYLQTTKDGLLDIEIARKLMESESSTYNDVSRRIL